MPGTVSPAQQRLLPPDVTAPAARGSNSSRRTPSRQRSSCCPQQLSCRSTRRMGSCCPTPDALLALTQGHMTATRPGSFCRTAQRTAPAAPARGLLPPQRNGSAQRLLAPCATRLGLERRWETPPDSMSAMTLTGTLPVRRNVNLGSSASCLRALETSRSSKLNCRI